MNTEIIRYIVYLCCLGKIFTHMYIYIYQYVCTPYTLLGALLCIDRYLRIKNVDLCIAILKLPEAIPNVCEKNTFYVF